MLDEQNLLTIASLIKWKSGEALSLPDMERMLRLFEVADLKIDMPDQQTVAALQTRLRAIIQAKYIGNPK